MKKKKRLWLKLLIAFILFLTVFYQYIWNWRRRYHRDYSKDYGYYAYDIENVQVHNMLFRFRQVKEVTDIDQCFYEMYADYNEIFINSDVEHLNTFNIYTNNFTHNNYSCFAKRCFLDENGNAAAAAVSLNFYKDNHPYEINIYVSEKQLPREMHILPNAAKDEGEMEIIYDHCPSYIEEEKALKIFNNRFAAVYQYDSKYYYFYSYHDLDQREIYTYCDTLYQIMDKIHNEGTAAQ